MEIFLWFGGFWLALVVIGRLVNLVRRAHEYDRLKPRLDTLDELARQLDVREQTITSASHALDEKGKAIVQLAKEKAKGFPWLADAYAEFYELEELQKARALAKKSHPAKKAAQAVAESARERRLAQKEARVLRYQLKFYETLFPWLADFRNEEVDDDLIRIRTGEADDESSEDPARRWLTPAEYAELSTSEKYQLALNRYWKQRKSKWEIGRDYERYIGYRFEIRQYQVTYQGIIEGFDDLGRDLICLKGAETVVVQCKRWSREKTIHEKHVFQLYGSVIAYQVDHGVKDVKGWFITTTKLSERAKMFARTLNITVTEGVALKEYPSIKCNVSRIDNTKIYHLPFDQQYDRTFVEPERGEQYVATVAEAERLGFRRAFRYRGGETRATT